MWNPSTTDNHLDSLFYIQTIHYKYKYSWSAINSCSIIWTSSFPYPNLINWPDSRMPNTHWHATALTQWPNDQKWFIPQFLAFLTGLSSQGIIIFIKDTALHHHMHSIPISPLLLIHSFHEVTTSLFISTKWHAFAFKIKVVSFFPLHSNHKKWSLCCWHSHKFFIRLHYIHFHIPTLIFFLGTILIHISYFHHNNFFLLVPLPSPSPLLPKSPKGVVTRPGVINLSSSQQSEKKLQERREHVYIY